jgi:hypothetical protein
MLKEYVKVAYLDKVATEKDGTSTIRSRLLYDVLKEQSRMERPEDDLLRDEAKVRRYKESKPGYFPIHLPYNEMYYDDYVFREGHLVFIDIDTTVLADEVFNRSDELKALMPSLLAVWYSMRGKLHFAFLCHWSSDKEYPAYWYLISKELIDCVGKTFGRDVAICWEKDNDNSLSSCKHLMSAGYSKDFKWYEDTDLFEVPPETKKEAVKRYEYRSIPIKKPEPYSLFKDKEVMRKWKKTRVVKNFVKWCEENRKYKYYTQDKEYDFRGETINGVTYKVWRNDGSVHRLKISGGSFKLTDYRKRHVSAAAILAICFCNASFEEALYSTAKFYLENCEEHTAAEGGCDIVREKVEAVYANKERNLQMCLSTGFLLEKRQVVIGGNDAEELDEEPLFNVQVTSIVKRTDRERIFMELYEAGAPLAVMTMKMRANGYPKISEQVTYKVARECGIMLDKPENKYKDRYKGRYSYKSKYRNAYSRDGRRTMVLAEKIDGVSWFASKKALEDRIAEEWREQMEKLFAGGDDVVVTRVPTVDAC